MRAVGPVAGGAAGLLDALRAAIGPPGTLVMPAMTGTCRPEPFDARRSPSRGMGVLAEALRRAPGALRSPHPTSSFAALGPQAAAITAAQPLTPPHGTDSPIGRVHGLDGRILLLGVGHERDTTLHLAELLAGVPYAVTRWAVVAGLDGPRRVDFAENDHCCRNFALADAWLREAGVQREGRVGTAAARLVTSRDLVRVVVPRLRAAPLRFLCPPGAGCGRCDEARAAAVAAGG